MVLSQLNELTPDTGKNLIFLLIFLCFTLISSIWSSTWFTILSLSSNTSVSSSYSWWSATDEWLLITLTLENDSEGVTTRVGESAGVDDEINCRGFSGGSTKISILEIASLCCLVSWPKRFGLTSWSTGSSQLLPLPDSLLIQLLRSRALWMTGTCSPVDRFEEERVERSDLRVWSRTLPQSQRSRSELSWRGRLVGRL